MQNELLLLLSPKYKHPLNMILENGKKIIFIIKLKNKPPPKYDFSEATRHLVT